MRRRLVPAVLAGLLLTGCGTTVPLSQQVSTGPGTTDSLGTTGGGAPPSATPQAEGTPTGSISSGTTGATLGPSSTGGGTGAVTTTGTTTGVAPQLGSGPGVTDTTIKIGYTYYVNSKAGEEALGATFDYGDPNADLKAAIDWVNTHGGVGGRKLVLELYADDSSVSTTRSFDQDYQIQCDHFTQDVKVFAVLGASYPLYRKCLASRGVLPVGASREDMSLADFQGTPLYYDVSGLPTDKAMTNMVLGLLRTKYFTERWDPNVGAPGGTAPVVLGIIHSDRPQWQYAVKRALIPELTAHGIKVSTQNVFEYHQNTDASGAGTTVSSIQSAVLKFRQQGVTHVIAPEAAGLGFFARGAENQRSRPRYGVSTVASVQADVDGKVIPPEQMAGALGIGWVPAYDLTDSSKYTPPGKATCLKAMRAKGIDESGGLAQAVALAACELVFPLQAALRGVTSSQPVTRERLIAGIEALGDSYVSAALPKVSYGPGKHYAISQAWLWAWDTTCGCATYTSGPFPLR
jgi:hypothetical protein